MSDPIPYKPQDNTAWPPSLFPPYKSTVKRAPTKPLVIIPQTLSEVTGPVYGHNKVEQHDHDLTLGHAGEPLGERIDIEGRIVDGDGAPLPDALIEIWQANSEGRYDHAEDKQEKALDPTFHGWGRSATDKDGKFRFHTIKPGPVPGPGNTLQAP